MILIIYTSLLAEICNFRCCGSVIFRTSLFNVSIKSNTRPLFCCSLNILFQCHLFLPSFFQKKILFLCSIHTYIMLNYIHVISLFRHTELSIELRLMLNFSQLKFQMSWLITCSIPLINKYS